MLLSILLGIATTRADAADISGRAAEPIAVERTLTYLCDIMGQGFSFENVKAQIDIALPGSARPGERLRAQSDLKITFVLSSAIGDLLRGVGATTAEGTALVDVDAVVEGTPVTLRIPGVRMPRVPVPPAGAVPAGLAGEVPSLIVYGPGVIDLAAGRDFALDLDLRDAKGETVLDPSYRRTPCEAVDGQDRHLATIPVTE